MNETETKDDASKPVSDDFEQQTNDETVAAGEIFDQEQMDRDLAAQRAGGALNPTGYTGPTASRPNPNLTEELQGMQLTPKVVGPPQYGSPDPATVASKLVPLEDHPLATLPEGHPAAIDESYGTEAPDSGGGDAPGTQEEIDATETAQKLADEEGVDLSQVEGTGADGRITKADVEDYIEKRDSENDN